MADSAELNIIVSCTTELKSALRGVDSDLVHFLRDEEFISEEVHDHILNSGSKVEDLVMLIRSRVEQDPMCYHVLVQYFAANVESYQAILRTLGAAYITQRAAVRRSNCLVQGEGSVCTISGLLKPVTQDKLFRSVATQKMRIHACQNVCMHFFYH